MVSAKVPRSKFFAAFLFEILSSVTKHASDGAVEVDGICSRGLPSACRAVCTGESPPSVGVKVANNFPHGAGGVSQ